LIKRGRKVTIVDTAEVPGEGMIDFRLGLFLDWLGEKGVPLINGVQSMEIRDEGVVITAKDGDRQILQADSVIATSPLAPNHGLLESLEGKVPEVYAVGDCREPRMIVDAIADGWRIGNEI
jgi:thioredoxin reductase